MTIHHNNQKINPDGMESGGINLKNKGREAVEERKNGR
tara:strand:- start:786 stop:899 length:114 start_codon:yes stop_codon:yes gene_type:complete